MSNKDKVYRLEDLEISKNNTHKKLDEKSSKILESNITNIENPIFQDRKSVV